MCFLRVIEAKLPLGFRFHPRDEELISDYLAGKVSGNCNGFPTMLVDVDLNNCDPWNLPETACVGGKQWYFYSQSGRKYASGKRTNRSAASGYWKATGKDRPIVDHRRGGLVGMRKTLVFYLGRAAKGKKTGWIMHEFRMERSAAGTTNGFSFKDWVLCRVFHKSRGSPSKPSMDNSHEDIGSSSLVPILDTFFSIEQDDMLSLGGCERLPYFSTQPPSLGWQPPPWSSSTSSHIWPAEENMAETAKSFNHPRKTPDVDFPCI